MCGRFALWTPPGVITRYFKVSVAPDIQPRYNVAPGQQILAICQTVDAQRMPAMLKWGLIPSWAKEESIGYKMINVREESVKVKPGFKLAYKFRRCLVPVSGFYEWQKEGSGKQPYLIRLSGSDLFALAGIWESWKKPASDERIESCAILTTSANGVISRVHDRMPVIIGPEHIDLWLDASSSIHRIEALMRPFDDRDMVCHRVSSAVNNAKNDAPSLIECQ
ncbi:MAG: SOS response-associated peptidase [Desulfobacterales bacterium]|jgi:putative SOS response-associated peptidase YedK|nr:SOS response-associated peptidase [Desulfobacterales bacterium]